MKLKSGSGEHVCFILLQLVNRALKTRRFQFKMPRFEKVDKTEEEPDMEQGEEDRDEPEDNIDISEEDDFDANERKALEEAFPERQIIESTVDHKEWMLEVERVAPKLRIPAPNDAKEWRNHIEMTRSYNTQVKKLIPDARSTLEKTSENLAKLLEKISKKERGINVNMNELGTEYKAKAEELKTIVNRYNELNNIVKEYREKYKDLTDKYEVTRGKIANQGEVATQTSPVVQIKNAIENLKNEM
mmetsp:Transcript_37968/g.34003  ORF Transcript_37968/g.34003 Transcript_37968/m.34003 type:complete len:245 (+) Transcript_37968:375-1109(+)